MNHHYDVMLFGSNQKIIIKIQRHLSETLLLNNHGKNPNSKEVLDSLVRATQAIECTGSTSFLLRITLDLFR